LKALRDGGRGLLFTQAQPCSAIQQEQVRYNGQVSGPRASMSACAASNAAVSAASRVEKVS
jgi:hypothetical protein